MAFITKDVKSRPAGINDNYGIAVMDINNIVEKHKLVLKTKGYKVSALSTELAQGIVIKAYDGGRISEKEL